MNNKIELSQTALLQSIIIILFFSSLITFSSLPDVGFIVKMPKGNVVSQNKMAIPLKLINDQFTIEKNQTKVNNTHSDQRVIFLPIIFRAPNPPLDFNKKSPTSGSTGISLTPTLSWNQTTPVTRYEYCFDKTNDNACTNWISTGTNTYAGLSGLQEGATYYWAHRWV